jgi:hypothetical protein
MPRVEQARLLAAVTQTTTSESVNVETASRITLAFTRANHSAGSSAFKIQVSVDVSTYVDFNSLIRDQNDTNAESEARVTTITLSSDTTVIASMDMEYHNFKWIRAVVTETTDGTHTAVALIERKV